VQGLIKFGGDRPELGEEVPGDPYEVVMLVVVPDVEGERINDAIIGICLLERVHGPMLGDPPGTEGVQQQTDAQQGREQQEKNRFTSEIDQEEVGEPSVADEVEKCSPLKWLRGTDEPDGLENRKEREPGSLSEHRMSEDFVFDGGGHIGIFVCFIQKGVVLSMEVSEGNPRRDDVCSVA